MSFKTRKKNIALRTCFLFLTAQAFGQVGIDTDQPHLSSVFDMSQTKKGLITPRIALTGSLDINTIKTPKQGLLIYNTIKNNDISPGYYYWSLNRWEPLAGLDTSLIINESVSINASALGYNPSGSATASPDSFTYGNIIVTKKKCASFTDTEKGAIEHSYCGYSLSEDITWEQAFNIAKIFKGYITSITSDKEWEFIKNNLLTVTEAQGNIWIGYSQNKEPGNPAEYTWVTGEKSKINWSNSSTLQTFYTNKEPNKTNKCIKINATSINANRTWDSQNCTNTANNNFIIIEFQNK